MADEAGPGTADAQQTEIRTFLIADVRGYTLFTQERGDEAAAKLAKKFAELAREGVEGRGGLVTELRGDEALCVFSSPRQAIRAAVDLQQRFVDETLDAKRPIVRVGGELEHPTLQDVALVATCYGLSNRALGTVGLLGPVRMDYDKAIRSVRSAAHELSRFVEAVYAEN